ncbi:MAG: hypothetical protein KAU95_02930 [Candidatus Aenigmarchaeota archaeon]|nr:hypothetical protein [Candidatus Aenigmarchaeota archaeon]
MSEEAFRRVKEKLRDKLGERELEQNQYWQTAYQYLCEEGILDEEGIVEGSYDDSNNWEVGIRLAAGLKRKIPAMDYWGLEKRYVCREDMELSPEAQEDLKKFYELEKSTEEYLREHIKDEPILESDCERMVENYLMYQTDLLNLTSLVEQREAMIRIETSMKSKFDAKKDPIKIGKYDLRSLEEALDKI